MDRESHRQIGQCKAVLNERIDFVITVENLVILPENVIVIQTELNPIEINFIPIMGMFKDLHLFSFKVVLLPSPCLNQ
jgi:hypothetical protein